MLAPSSHKNLTPKTKDRCSCPIHKCCQGSWENGLELLLHYFDIGIILCWERYLLYSYSLKTSLKLVLMFLYPKGGSYTSEACVPLFSTFPLLWWFHLLSPVRWNFLWGVCVCLCVIYFMWEHSHGIFYVDILVCIHACSGHRLSLDLSLNRSILFCWERISQWTWSSMTLLE